MHRIRKRHTSHRKRSKHPHMTQKLEEPIIETQDILDCLDEQILFELTEESDFDEDDPETLEEPKRSELFIAARECVQFRSAEKLHGYNCPTCNTNHYAKLRDFFYCDVCGQLLENPYAKK